MSDPTPLPKERLRRRCDPEALEFRTTAELAEVPGIIGQERAEEAVRFAIGIRRYGYNLYALGTTGMGKHGFVRAFLERRAAHEPAPADCCYVHDFADSRRPRALRLPPGRGPALRQDLRELVEELHDDDPGGLRERRLPHPTQAGGDAVQRGGASAASQTSWRRPASAGWPSSARRRASVSLPCTRVRCSSPTHSPTCRRESRSACTTRWQQAQRELAEAAAAAPREARKHREELRKLDRLVTAAATRQLIDELRARWADVPAVLEHLAEVERDVIDNARGLPAAAGDTDHGPGPARRRAPRRRRRTATR